MVSDEFAGERSASERLRLLDGVPRHEEHDEPHRSSIKAGLVLPVSLLASVSLHMTAASTVFVYASLFCAHPKHCEDLEKSQYAGSVAMATVLANITSLLSLRYLECVMQWDTCVGLVTWLSCRGLGALGLIAGGVCSISTPPKIMVVIELTAYSIFPQSFF